MILDSDIMIYFLKGDSEVINNIKQLNPVELYTTRINYTELLYGAYNSSKIEKNLENVLAFMDNLNILEFDKKSSEVFAKLKTKLKKEGNIIADMDLMIAAISISNNKPLYTNNLKHFKRIKELELFISIDTEIVEK